MRYDVSHAESETESLVLWSASLPPVASTSDLEWPTVFHTSPARAVAPRSFGCAAEETRGGAETRPGLLLRQRYRSGRVVFVQSHANL